MARTLSEILTAISDRAALLSARLEAVEHENAELRRKLDETSELLDETRKERDRALIDVEFLTVSHRLADSPQAIVDTRRLISRMIRTLDRCIALLKDDPQI